MEKYLVTLMSVLALMYCSSGDDSIPEPNPGNPNMGGGNPPTSDWLIPRDKVIDGGPGKDGIPALVDPNTISVSEVTYLDEDDLVIGFKWGDEVKAYPHKILDWHEIINDQVGGKPIAITYCPLTGTSIVWDRLVDGDVTSFGVSGLLYNSNLIPYDRKTESNWSQMRLDCVNGPLKGEKIITHPLIETTWKTWKKMFPNSGVVSTKTTYSRNYSQYPYGDYRTNHENIIFPYEPMDGRIPSKERVLGIITQKRTKAFRFSNFTKSDVVVWEEIIGERPVVIFGSKNHQFMVAFERATSSTSDLIFQSLDGNSLLDNGGVATDQMGNLWNVFGEATAGPLKGEKLLPVTNYIGYWFSWGAFYPDLELQVK